MNYKQSLIEAICKHPAVSRAISGKERTPALELLVNLRKARRDTKRTIRNAREESGHATPETGIYAIPCPGDRLLRESLHAEGLPADLRQLIEQAIALK